MGISIRPTGMTSATHALRYWERRQEVAANNLANVSTDGFKAERAFARLLDTAHPTIDTATDLRSGTLRPTGEPMDIALAGDGFLVVGTPEGERLTRGGSFRFDDESRLVDLQGNPLLGVDGEIVLKPGERTPDAVDVDPLAAPQSGGPLVQVDRVGRVQVNGRTIATLRMEQIPAAQNLQHVGAGLFVPPEGRANVADADRDIRQGFLEDSNVSTVGAMVDMIGIQRAYASVQKAVTTLDQMRGIITSELAKPV